jgi:predicted small lipoprotein YifL
VPPDDTVHDPVFGLSGMNRRSLAKGAVLALVLVAIAGCGRRGALEPPVGATVAPRAAASERMVAPVAQVTPPNPGDLDNDASVADPLARRGQNREVETVPAPIDPNKADKPFFLDPLVK